MILILLLLTALLLSLIFGAKIRRKQVIARWRRALALDKHEAVFQKLYANVNCFMISKEARKEQDAFEYVYGEIEFTSFIALLGLCHPDSSTVFYDLGSGTGKAVLACAMVFSVKKSCGIEFFAPLHQAAEAQQQQLKKITDYTLKSNSIKFYQGNFLSKNFNEASLIFINATAFFGETWSALCERLEQTNAKTVIITTSKALPASGFQLLKVTKVRMSWGFVDAFIHQNLQKKINKAKIKPTVI